MKRRRRLAMLLTASVLVVGAIAAGCDDDDDGGDDGSSGEETSETTGGNLSGSVLVDGSSTVFPLSGAAAEGFKDVESGVNVEVRSSGTGGGFEVFCTGETDISNASRPIKDEEAETCASNGVEYEEIRVGSDGITVVTGANSPVEGDLTIDQLNQVWNPDSTVSNWSEIGFAAAPLTLAGPDDQSGTYDFFNEEVLGEDAEGETITPRSDYTASADDNVIVNAVTGAEAALGYFGYSYFSENTDILKAFSIDGVEPTVESINADEYPLSRPLFIYVSKSKLAEKPELAGFVTYYLENAIELAESVDVVPAPQDALDAGLAVIAAG